MPQAENLPVGTVGVSLLSSSMGWQHILYVGGFQENPTSFCGPPHMLCAFARHRMINFVLTWLTSEGESELLPSMSEDCGSGGRKALLQSSDMAALVCV